MLNALLTIHQKETGEHRPTRKASSAQTLTDIEDVILLLQDETVMELFEFIKLNLTPIAKYISKIEQNSMNSDDFFTSFHELAISILSNDAVPDVIKLKLQTVVQRNEGLKSLAIYHTCKFASKLYSSEIFYYHLNHFFI